MIAIQNVLPMSPHVPLPISQVHTLVRGEVGARRRSATGEVGRWPSHPRALFFCTDFESGAAVFAAASVSCTAVRRVDIGAASSIAPLPATPLRGFRRPLLGQGQVRREDRSLP